MLVQNHFKNQQYLFQTPPEIVDAAVELIHMDVFRNIVHMSNDELDIVVDLDERLLEKKDVIHFYYGLKDGWCPVEHGEYFQSPFGNKTFSRLRNAGETRD